MSRLAARILAAAGSQIGLCQVVVRLDQCRLQTHCAFERLDGVRGVVHSKKHQADVVHGLGICWIDLDRAPQFDEGFL